jgi:hypothetical protein
MYKLEVDIMLYRMELKCLEVVQDKVRWLAPSQYSGIDKGYIKFKFILPLNSF